MKREANYPKLRQEMKSRKETQKKLAELLGLTRGTISKKLAGKIEWSISEVETICEHYGKDYYQLFK